MHNLPQSTIEKLHADKYLIKARNTMISKKLIEKTIKYFEKHQNKEFVVNPSLPILYFGNLNAYSKSKYKILTVGKNPSDNELRLKKKDSYSFCRFPDWIVEKRNLIDCLNSYFEKNPLKQWFSSFEPILNGLDCSYYQNRNLENIAIHTDICSPLATNPTWSKLTKNEQATLFEEGVEIWRELIEELQPDLILASIPLHLFKKVFPENGELLISYSLKKDETMRKKEYKVFIHKHILKSGKQTKVFFGQAANKPFDTISRTQKINIGINIKKHA